jgi:hypothetical protein
MVFSVNFGIDSTADDVPPDLNSGISSATARVGTDNNEYRPNQDYHAITDRHHLRLKGFRSAYLISGHLRLAVGIGLTTRGIYLIFPRDDVTSPRIVHDT